MLSPRASAYLVVAACLATVAACGGGKSAAEKSRAAASQAKAACDVFAHFHQPSATGRQAEIAYAKASYGAFLESAALATKAADQDPRWKPLESAAEHEAAAFGVISNAAAGASVQVNVAAVQRAVAITKATRPAFIAECAKADPSFFKLAVTASPSASATAP